MTAVALHNNHAATAGTLSQLKAMDSQSSGSTDSSTEASTISANDFLTLLVTEMKNQDPTANTDPNEYINQLVNVNSLEQLISINQTLGTALDPSDTTSTSEATRNSGSAMHVAAAGSSSPATEGQTPASAAIHTVAGNLNIPSVNGSAQRVAGALSERNSVNNPQHSAF